MAVFLFVFSPIPLEDYKRGRIVLPLQQFFFFGLFLNECKMETYSGRDHFQNRRKSGVYGGERGESRKKMLLGHFIL